MAAMTYPRPTLATYARVILAEAYFRLVNITRYPGQLAMDFVVPIIITLIPILQGRSLAGDQAAAIFEANTGTANYVGFLLIGSAAYTLVSMAFWHVAYWLRFEQETGTLEAVYLTPSSPSLLVVGVAIYSFVRGFAAMLFSYVIGCLIFGVNPLSGDVLLALVFVMVGVIPVYALALLFGAVVLKVKESNALISLMQWVVSFLMGIYFPITVLPPLARALALAFPPTWMTNGVRSALLGVGFFFGEWYFDLALLATFVVITPLVGLWLFRQAEESVRRNEGVGEF